MLRSLIDALLAASPGHALIQFHDTDGSLLRELHAVADDLGMRVAIFANCTRGGGHEIRISECAAIVVHDMNGRWKPTEASNDEWSPAQHVAMGVAS